ncbi:MAG TPA: hypothetical protein VHE54_10880, partial [Puia sp.]|nr:hypothetical protein [Puia sp.]
METINPPSVPDIPIRRTHRSRLHEIEWDHLELGQYNSDHMLVCDYADGVWHQPEILPFGSFTLL